METINRKHKVKDALALYSIRELKEVSEDAYNRVIAEYTEEYERTRNPVWEFECELEFVKEVLVSMGYADCKLDYLIGGRGERFKISTADVDAEVVIKRLPETVLTADQAALALASLSRRGDGTIDYSWCPYRHQVEFTSMVADVCECEEGECHTNTCIAEQASTEMLCKILDEAFVQDKESLEDRFLAQLRAAYEGDSSEDIIIEMLEDESYKFTLDGCVARY